MRRRSGVDVAAVEVVARLAQVEAGVEAALGGERW